MPHSTSSTRTRQHARQFPRRFPPAEEPAGPTATRAFAVPVEKPITRARAINAAEMEAYGLRDAMEVASFNAALARKWREHPDDQECLEHDRFIEDVKTELTAMGIV